MKVIITTAARADLALIGDYIGADNPARAQSFTDELVDRCEDLASMAKRFQRVPRLAQVDIRRRPYKGYLIFAASWMKRSKCSTLSTVRGTGSNCFLTGKRLENETPEGLCRSQRDN